MAEDEAVAEDDPMAQDDAVVGEVADGDEPPPMETPRPSREARQRRATGPSGQPSICLEAIQGKMNLANVRERTRATTTLVTHRREIEKLVLFFCDNCRHLTGEALGVTLKLCDNKKCPEDNHGVETERSDESERRLVCRQMKPMVGEARWNEFGVQDTVLSALPRIGLKWFQLHSDNSRPILECHDLDLPCPEVGWRRSPRSVLHN
jgi:hypothetical protein